MTRATKHPLVTLTLLALAVILAWTPAGSADTVAWNKQLETIEHDLAAAKWDSALASAQRLADAIVQESSRRSENRRPLAWAAAYEALAEAGLGRDKAAQWHWYLAQNLDPAVRQIDLSRYDVAGKTLRRHHLLPAAEQHPLTDAYDPESNPGLFRHPQRTGVVYPKRPRALSEHDRFSHAVFVQLTIDDQGEISQPLVMDANNYPGLVYNAFEALKDWSFEPATHRGEPVTFRFVIPVVFADDRPEQSAVFFGP